MDVKIKKTSTCFKKFGFQLKFWKEEDKITMTFIYECSNETCEDI